ncbi:MAG: PadR family transcriptional regulator [Deltaproteobacteria bacterium]|nr:PadR family transcriptional regulator [Deltaproteobacteria bacterium]
MLRGMALDHLVLGLTAAGVRHGYAIWKHIDAMLGGRRAVQRSHVYGALASLQRRGLAVAREERPDGRRPRCRFDPTPRGRDWLAAWLAHEPRGVTAVLQRTLFMKVAVRGLLGEQPARREVGAERSARLRPAGRVAGDDPLVRLLGERRRRRLEVELWLCDRLDEPARSGATRPRPG